MSSINKIYHYNIFVENNAENGIYKSVLEDILESKGTARLLFLALKTSISHLNLRIEFNKFNCNSQSVHILLFLTRILIKHLVIH